MKIERLEYGDDPDSDFPEEFDSFKVFTVWSEPDINIVENEFPVEYKDFEELDSGKGAKRLAVAVEYSMHQGGYFFIETPNPDTEWLNRVWEHLKELGWQGYSFNDIRSNCRGHIKVIKRKDYSAVIDKKNEKIFHNRAKPKGAGAVDDLDNFWDRAEKGS